VYRSDIAPVGFKVVSLGGRAAKNRETGFYEVPRPRLRHAAEELAALLTGPDTVAQMEANWRIGHEWFSLDRLKSLMSAALRRESAR
jgi:hypothetical protein